MRSSGNGGEDAKYVESGGTAAWDSQAKPKPDDARSRCGPQAQCQLALGCLQAKLFYMR